MPGGCLLHAISRAGPDPSVPGVELVEADGLRAACSKLDERADQADPEWLAAAAQRHHEIVRQLFAYGPVLPIRFGTVVDVVAIPDLLQRHRDTLAAELDRLDGAAEWGVKLFIDPDTLRRSAEQSSEKISNIDRELAGSAPGRSYLLKRKREAALADALEQQSKALVEQVRMDLAAAALDARDLPLPTAAVADPEPLANLAFLVRDAQSDVFMAASDSAAERHGLEIELSGPWPPYSFVELELGEDVP
jgi:hypothetical protein